MSYKNKVTAWVAIFLLIWTWPISLQAQTSEEKAAAPAAEPSTPSSQTEADKLSSQCDLLIKKQYFVLEDEGLNKSLQKMVTSLAASADRPLPDLKVTVLNDPIPNVFSFPGNIYVTTGLLDMLGSKEELAYVLAREIAYLAGNTHTDFYVSERNKKRAIGTGLTILKWGLVVGGAIVPMASVGSGIAKSATNFALRASLMTAGFLAGAALVDQFSKVPLTSHLQALKAETVIENQISALKRQSLLAQQRGQTEAQQRLNAEVRKLAGQKDKFVAELRQKNPAYADLWYPQPVSPSQVPLTGGEYLLRYKVTDDATLVWLVKGGAIVQMVKAPVSRAALRQKVQQYLAPFQEVSSKSQLERYDAKLAKELYDLLMKPALAQVGAGAHVVIIPDDILEVLPFESLVAEGPAQTTMAQGQYGPYPQGVKYVADQYKVSYYFSATTMKIMRAGRKATSSSQSLCMVADPMAGGKGQAPGGEVQRRLMSMSQKDEWKSLRDQFEPLPYTRELADKLKGLFPDGRFLVGSAATKQNLSGIEKDKYLVFATHGILARELPYIVEPALLLYPESGGGEEYRPRGFLTMSDVMKLNLTCDNATLTACSTGLGKRTSGEGVMSMGWAFQYAGAKSVLVSLWKVEEKSTILLAEKFFGNLKAGKDKLTALQEARADVRKAGYEHPFFWSPFIMIGEVR
ncbi:MAG: CHAT domain-containing protein [Deltaproteobacteria bacterium]|nr:MAG: CHAT domain-containing protein [Deltaproteobacteria bacterium]